MIKFLYYRHNSYQICFPAICFWISEWMKDSKVDQRRNQVFHLHLWLLATSWTGDFNADSFSRWVLLFINLIFYLKFTWIFWWFWLFFMEILVEYQAPSRDVLIWVEIFSNIYSVIKAKTHISTFFRRSRYQPRWDEPI